MSDSIVQKAAIMDRKKSIPCRLEVASAQTLCISAVQQSVPNPVAIPEDKVRNDQSERMVWVEGMSDALKQCYRDWKMPHEIGVSWASCGKEIYMTENSLYQLLQNEQKHRN